jgi:hypothetical protein
MSEFFNREEFISAEVSQKEKHSWSPSEMRSDYEQNLALIDKTFQNLMDFLETYENKDALIKLIHRASTAAMTVKSPRLAEFFSQIEKYDDIEWEMLGNEDVLPYYDGFRHIVAPGVNDAINVIVGS